MRPFLTSFILTVVVAAVLWYRQHATVADLRKQLASPAAAVVPASSHAVPAVKSKPESKRKEAPALRRADGSEVVTSRSMFRGMLEAMDYFRHLSRSEVEALLAAGIEDGDDLLGSYTAMALARLAEYDPAAALKLAGALARTKDDSSAFSLIMHDWLIRDRAAALKWFHAQPDTNAKAGFMGVAGMVLAQSDPDLLKQLSGSFEDPDVHDDALQQSIMMQGLNDPRAALARLEELADDDSRAELLYSLTMSGGDKIPREMLEAALPYAKNNEMLRRSMAMLLGNMATTDAKGALEWMRQRPAQDFALFSDPAAPVLIQKFGDLETPHVVAATRDLTPAQRDWLLASHYAGRPLVDPAALLTATQTSVSDHALRDAAVRRILQRTARAGNQATLEPWLNSLPGDEQATARKILATSATEE
jgi:hypothetical protein